MSLFDACVDLNPHQIEAALFALRSPISKGVLLADEVGLGKTIEAGIAICQFWAERKRRLLVICPASLRKQWALELEEKFNLPSVILDARSHRLAVKSGNPEPFACGKIVIVSFNFANKMKGSVRAVPWNLVVIDEAHKLRNAYRPSNIIGQGILWAIGERRKLLLTATPLQNSLLELYGLSTIIDQLIFGDLGSFRSQYTSADADLDGLRSRLRSFCKRTLRKHVTEYIRYTERKPITCPFSPSDDEHRLYESVSEFLAREDTYAVPHRQRHLTALILRKLLASSSHAIAGTLDAMKERLEAIRDGLQDAEDAEPFIDHLVDQEELEDELLDEILGESDDVPPVEGNTQQEPEKKIDLTKLMAEIDELGKYATWARSIGIDTKTRALLKALEIGFNNMSSMGALPKAVVFTESLRTQTYVRNFLEANGYAGKVISFNGSNTGPDANALLERWQAANKTTGRATGSRPIDVRTALIDNFSDPSGAPIMIATEAAAEGINLQFCSLVINYDLPWNPQRIEQRIGRCHRYGQEHDVVVVNFLNQRNEADRRVLELLTEKFHIFDGIFGASDEVLGSIESGVDFEKRILGIYEKCRTTEQIQAAFQQIQSEMEEKIKAKLDETRQLLLEHFDEEVHNRLRCQLDSTKAQLDRFGKMFWMLTKFILAQRAGFDDSALAFDLYDPPPPGGSNPIRQGRYRLISKAKDHKNEVGDFLYRLSHPLGEFVIETGKEVPTPLAQVTFNITNHPTRIAVVEDLKGHGGFLTLQKLTIDSFDREEHLLFSAFNDSGQMLDQETCQKLFHCKGQVAPASQVPDAADARLRAEAQQHAKATISRSLEANNVLFNEQREILEKWAEDKVLAAEKELADTKTQVKQLRRQARIALTVDEQHAIQMQIQEQEKKQRRQRQQIFDIEDEIAEKRDQLISALERRMSQKTTVQPLFTIRWAVE